MSIKDWFSTKKEVVPERDEAGTEASEPARSTRSFAPDVDIYEEGGDIVVVVDVPGIDQEDLKITVDNGTLTLDGAINLNRFDGLRPIYSEYRVGNYFRRFQLSDAVDPEGIKADLKDGVLEVHLPRKAAEKPVEIAVG